MITIIIKALLQIKYSPNNLLHDCYINDRHRVVMVLLSVVVVVAAVP